MEKAVPRKVRELLGEKFRGGSIKCRIIFCREFGMFDRLGLQIRETERDRFRDLLREIEIASGHLCEERVDEMESTEVVAVGSESGHDED